MTVAPTSIQPRREHHRSRGVLFAVVAFVLGGLAVALLYQFDVLGGSSPTSGTEGSGVPAAQTRAVAAFHSVELVGGNNVVIHVGAKQSVVVKADDDLLGHVTTTVKSETLVIGNTLGGLTTKSPMSVVVNVPTLSALTLAGGGNIVLSGSGTIHVTATKSLDASVPGSGTIIYSGNPQDVTKSITGSGAIIASQ